MYEVWRADVMEWHISPPLNEFDEETRYQLVVEHHRAGTQAEAMSAAKATMAALLEASPERPLEILCWNDKGTAYFEREEALDELNRQKLRLGMAIDLYQGLLDALPEDKTAQTQLEL